MAFLSHRLGDLGVTYAIPGWKAHDRLPAPGNITEHEQGTSPTNHCLSDN